MSTFLRLCLVAGLALPLQPALADAATDTYPERPINLVVPFPPGGGTDSLGRIVGEGLGKKFGQSVVVENRPGAAGVIGANQVSRAKPDGHTLLMAATGAIIPPKGMKAEDYKLEEHFAPVALVAAPPYILVVNKKVKANSVAELIDLMKSSGNGLTFASSGVGAASHIAGLQFQKLAGVNLLHIPYKGMGQAVTDVISNQVSMMFAPAPAVLPHIEAGNLKALAVTSKERSPLFPDYPTVDESGLPGYVSVGWFGLFAPPGTPEAIVTKLNREVNDLLATDVVREQLKTMGATPANETAKTFTDFVQRDVVELVNLLEAEPA